MSLHTKGPWEIASKQHKEGLIVWTAKDNLHIAYVTTDGDDEYHISEDIQKANARLIAAAPELLEILKKLLVTSTKDLKNPEHGIWDEVNKVIAKAEGK